MTHLNIYPSYIHLGRGPCPAASFARTRRRMRKSTGDCRRRALNGGRATTGVASPFPGAPTTDGCRQSRHLPLRSWNAGHPSGGMPCWRPGRANSSMTGWTRVHSLVLNHIWRSSVEGIGEIHISRRIFDGRGRLSKSTAICSGMLLLLCLPVAMARFTCINPE